MRSRSLDRRIEAQNKKKNLPKPPAEEELEEELERPVWLPLNKQKSVFDTGLPTGSTGINTAPSVFDRKAVFHTDHESD